MLYLFKNLDYFTKSLFVYNNYKKLNIKFVKN